MIYFFIPASRRLSLRLHRKKEQNKEIPVGIQKTWPQKIPTDKPNQNEPINVCYCVQQLGILNK